MAEIARAIVDPEDACAALTLFDPVWDVLEPRERARIVHLLIDRVEYDGVKGEVTVTFHPLGISSPADEVRQEPIEDAKQHDGNGKPVEEVIEA